MTFADATVVCHAPRTSWPSLARLWKKACGGRAGRERRRRVEADTGSDRMRRSVERSSRGREALVRRRERMRHAAARGPGDEVVHAGPRDGDAVRLVVERGRQRKAGAARNG